MPINTIDTTHQFDEFWSNVQGGGFSNNSRVKHLRDFDAISENNEKINQIVQKLPKEKGKEEQAAVAPTKIDKMVLGRELISILPEEERKHFNELGNKVSEKNLEARREQQRIASELKPDQQRVMRVLHEAQSAQKDMADEFIRLTERAHSKLNEAIAQGLIPARKDASDQELQVTIANYKTAQSKPKETNEAPKKDVYSEYFGLTDPTIFEFTNVTDEEIKKLVVSTNGNVDGGLIAQNLHYYTGLLDDLNKQIIIETERNITNREDLDASHARQKKLTKEIDYVKDQIKILNKHQEVFCGILMKRTVDRARGTIANASNYSENDAKKALNIHRNIGTRNKNMPVFLSEGLRFLNVSAATQKNVLTPYLSLAIDKFNEQLSKINADKKGPGIGEQIFRKVKKPLDNLREKKALARDVQATDIRQLDFNLKSIAKDTAAVNILPLPALIEACSIADKLSDAIYLYDNEDPKQGSVFYDQYQNSTEVRDFSYARIFQELSYVNELTPEQYQKLSSLIELEHKDDFIRKTSIAHQIINADPKQYIVESSTIPGVQELETLAINQLFASFNQATPEQKEALAILENIINGDEDILKKYANYPADEVNLGKLTEKLSVLFPDVPESDRKNMGAALLQAALSKFVVPRFVGQGQAFANQYNGIFEYIEHRGKLVTKFTTYEAIRTRIYPEGKEQYKIPANKNENKVIILPQMQEDAFKFLKNINGPSALGDVDIAWMIIGKKENADKIVNGDYSIGYEIQQYRTQFKENKSIDPSIFYRIKKYQDFIKDNKITGQHAGLNEETGSLLYLETIVTKRFNYLKNQILVGNDISLSYGDKMALSEMIKSFNITDGELAEYTPEQLDRLSNSLALFACSDDTVSRIINRKLDFYFMGGDSPGLSEQEISKIKGASNFKFFVPTNRKFEFYDGKSLDDENLKIFIHCCNRDDLKEKYAQSLINHLASYPFIEAETVERCFSYNSQACNQYLQDEMGKIERGESKTSRDFILFLSKSKNAEVAKRFIEHHLKNNSLQTLTDEQADAVLNVFDNNNISILASTLINVSTQARISINKKNFPLAAGGFPLRFYQKFIGKIQSMLPFFGGDKLRIKNLNEYIANATPIVNSQRVNDFNKAISSGNSKGAVNVYFELLGDINKAMFYDQKTAGLSKDRVDIERKMINAFYTMTPDERDQFIIKLKDKKNEIGDENHYLKIEDDYKYYLSLEQFSHLSKENRNEFIRIMGKSETAELTEKEAELLGSVGMSKAQLADFKEINQQLDTNENYATNNLNDFARNNNIWRIHRSDDMFLFLEKTHEKMKKQAQVEQGQSLGDVLTKLDEGLQQPTPNIMGLFAGQVALFNTVTQIKSIENTIRVTDKDTLMDYMLSIENIIAKIDGVKGLESQKYRLLVSYHMLVANYNLRDNSVPPYEIPAQMELTHEEFVWLGNMFGLKDSLANPNPSSKDIEAVEAAYENFFPSENISESISEGDNFSERGRNDSNASTPDLAEPPELRNENLAVQEEAKKPNKNADAMQKQALIEKYPFVAKSVETAYQEFRHKQEEKAQTATGQIVASRPATTVDIAQKFNQYFDKSFTSSSWISWSTSVPDPAAVTVRETLKELFELNQNPYIDQVANASESGVKTGEVDPETLINQFKLKGGEMAGNIRNFASSKGGYELGKVCSIARVLAAVDVYNLSEKGNDAKLALATILLQEHDNRPAKVSGASKFQDAVVECIESLGFTVQDLRQTLSSQQSVKGIELR